MAGHPLESAAFARRTPTTDVRDGAIAVCSPVMKTVTKEFVGSIGASLPTQSDPERIDAHVGCGRDGQGLFELLLVRLGRVAAPAPRQNARSRRHAGGVSQRFVRRAKKQRVGLPLGLVPILVEQRPL